MQTELPVAIAERKRPYKSSCEGCHKLFPMAKHYKSSWSGTLGRMATKAKITENQNIGL